MKKRIKEYLAYIDTLLEQEDVDWKKEKEKHLVQIAFFAHERLVHLAYVFPRAVQRCRGTLPDHAQHDDRPMHNRLRQEVRLHVRIAQQHQA